MRNTWEGQWFPDENRRMIKGDRLNKPPGAFRLRLPAGEILRDTNKQRTSGIVKRADEVKLDKMGYW
jgi:hypothetical protein